jgi:ABC-2 type transport system ATP-binding protein
LTAVLHHKVHLKALEFYLIDTCNIRCSNCSASSPFMTEANLPNLENFVASLSFLARVVQCDELRFVGGEPLLNKDLCNFIRAARHSGMFRRIRVITNGLLLSNVDEEFWRLADIVRISIYPSTAASFPEEKLECFRAAATKHKVQFEVIRDTHFMQAITDERIEDLGAVQRIFSTCGEAHDWSCHLLYRNRLYRCSRVHTLDRYLSKIGAEHEDFTREDGIIIDGRPSLRFDLQQYLKSEQPLKACSFCLGTSGPEMAHQQLTLADIRSKVKTPIAKTL